jgi:hypothetical protein
LLSLLSVLEAVNSRVADKKQDPDGYPVQVIANANAAVKSMIIANCSLGFSDNYFSSGRVVGNSSERGFSFHAVG